MLLSSPDLPQQLRAEAAVTACYIRNRATTSSSAQTFKELFHGTRPPTSHWFKAYSLKPEAKCSKLAARCSIGYLVGNQHGSKVYRSYCEGKIISSAGVTVVKSAPPRPLSSSQQPATAPETVMGKIIDVPA
jgi:hypothetical protein